MTHSLKKLKVQDKVAFEYAIIRFVPKVEREEFFNIGVIVYSKDNKYLGIKYKIDQKRFEVFGGEEQMEMISEYLKAWQHVCEGSVDGGKIGSQEMPYRFRWLTANRSTIIQSSEVHPGLTNDPAKTLEDLFSRYVL